MVRAFFYGFIDIVYRVTAWPDAAGRRRTSFVLLYIRSMCYIYIYIYMMREASDLTLIRSITLPRPSRLGVLDN